MPDLKPAIVFVGADASYMYSFRGPIIRHFVDAGYQVTIIATVGDGFEQEQYNLPEVELIDWALSKSHIGIVPNLTGFIRLIALLRRLKPVIVFSHTIKSVIFASLAASLLRIPRIVAMIPGLGFSFGNNHDRRNTFIKLAAHAGYKLSLSRTNLIIFQNEDDRKLLIDSHILDSEATTSIVNGSGVDVIRFKETSPPPGPLVYLMVARLIGQKGVREYIRAASIVKETIPDARFLLAGTADSNPDSVPAAEIDACRKRGLIEVLGHIEDPAPLYEQCHIFVLPTYYREGRPRVILEAMASGRPTITTDWVGCRDCIQDGETGILVEPRDSTSLANAMLTLGQSQNVRLQMGKAARRYCLEHFDVRKVSAETAALIEGTTSSSTIQMAPF